MENPITITFDITLNINSNTYFILNSDYINFWGNSSKSHLILNNILNYIGLIQNTSNSYIL